MITVKFTKNDGQEAKEVFNTVAEAQDYLNKVDKEDVDLSQPSGIYISGLGRNIHDISEPYNSLEKPERWLIR